MTKRALAIGMISGGLDSTLAVKIIQEQGIAVRGVNFSTGFCIYETKRALSKEDVNPKALKNEALRAGADLSFPVEIIDISREYISLITNPKYGYGSNMNPCIDCRIFMLKKAKELMDAEGADLVFTGEVLGQRPMSQHKDALLIVERDSGLKGRLLRPLSAKLLPETIPEQEGIVDREKLFAISGRSRKEQLYLAEKWDIQDVPTPAGGCCFLTDANYSKRLRDKISTLGNKPLSLNDITLLKVGRHFRLNNSLKCIIGRNEMENNFLDRYKNGRWHLTPAIVKGPVALSDEGEPSESDVEIIAKLIARFSDGRASESVEIEVLHNGLKKQIKINPDLDEIYIKKMWI